MAKSTITGFTVEPITEKAGLLGRKTAEDARLKMDTPGGSIYLRKSALVAAGGSWERLVHNLSATAKDKGIPFTDKTE